MRSRTFVAKALRHRYNQLPAGLGSMKRIGEMKELLVILTVAFLASLSASASVPEQAAGVFGCRIVKRIGES